jgi:hypothetical protein
LRELPPDRIVALVYGDWIALFLSTWSLNKRNPFTPVSLDIVCSSTSRRVTVMIVFPRFHAICLRHTNRTGGLKIRLMKEQNEHISRSEADATEDVTQEVNQVLNDRLERPLATFHQAGVQLGLTQPFPNISEGFDDLVHRGSLRRVILRHADAEVGDEAEV